MAKDVGKDSDVSYIGVDRFLVGVPARDLTAEEIEAGGWRADDLLASGLYQKSKAKPKGKEADKADEENK